MFNGERDEIMDEVLLGKYIEDYTKIFLTKQWPKEKFKWEAILTFQKEWDVDAVDFKTMFDRATSNTKSLLASQNYFPKGMILEFCDYDQETVRQMFKDLFNESLDLVLRIQQFISDADKIRKRYDDGSWKNHYQNVSTVSIYLWLRYPEKYFIYKYSHYRSICYKLKIKRMPRRGDVHSVIEAFEHYKEIQKMVQASTELVQTLFNVLDDNCYPDPHAAILSLDFIFYLATLKSDADQNWWPFEYSPGLSVEEWMALIQDPQIFTPSSLEIMKRMLDYGGEATCTQLAEKYGETRNFYNSGSRALAIRIHNQTDCPLLKDEENSRWWPVLYIGRDTNINERGNYVWRLRDELKQALERSDLSDVPLYANKNTNSAKHYWCINTDSDCLKCLKDDENCFYLLNDTVQITKKFPDLLNASKEDSVVFFKSSPLGRIIGVGEIVQNEEDDQIAFDMTKRLSDPLSILEINKTKLFKNMKFLDSLNEPFYQITQTEYDTLLNLIHESQLKPERMESNAYIKEDFLNEVYMTEEKYSHLLSLLKRKQNIILQGAPGVGKTFAAFRLGYAFLGYKDASRVKLIQFHQNYSYEDFVMGYKPDGNGFSIKYGVFYRFCIEAAKHPETNYVFIIDEINRGNISKIFGELLMMIEKEYRGKHVQLAYQENESFFVPNNVYLIGMMNTADRSLALIDYALRRRFSFVSMEPAFDVPGFVSYQKNFHNQHFDQIISLVKALNQEICNDPALGKGFCIGHSYFCNWNGEEEVLRDIILYDILPMLEEYWFDNEEKVKQWTSRLLEVFHD